ncbi:hypothetical protein GQ54DRAFT_196994 [Martensiomyces pterosporus]|nr:hypothetical protein GQ54DRAFT_196994 [Martensiomyces pterosporus]
MHTTLQHSAHHIHRLQRQQRHGHEQQRQHGHICDSSMHPSKANGAGSAGGLQQMSEEPDDIDDILSSLWPTTKADLHRHAAYHQLLLPPQDTAALDSNCHEGKPPPLTSLHINNPQWSSGQCTPPDDAKGAAVVPRGGAPQQSSFLLFAPHAPQPVPAEPRHSLDASHHLATGSTSTLHHNFHAQQPPSTRSVLATAAAGGGCSVYAAYHGSGSHMPRSADAGYARGNAAQCPVSRSISASIQIGDPEWRVDSPQEVHTAAGGQASAVFEQVSPRQLYHSTQKAMLPCPRHQDQSPANLPSPTSPTAPVPMLRSNAQLDNPAEQAMAARLPRGQPKTLGLCRGNVASSAGAAPTSVAAANRSVTSLGLLRGFVPTARTRPPPAHVLTREERVARLHTVSGLAARAVARRCLSGQIPAVLDTADILLQGPSSAVSAQARKQAADEAVQMLKKPTFADVARGAPEPIVGLSARPI